MGNELERKKIFWYYKRDGNTYIGSSLLQYIDKKPGVQTDLHHKPKDHTSGI